MLYVKYHSGARHPSQTKEDQLSHFTIFYISPHLLGQGTQRTVIKYTFCVYVDYAKMNPEVNGFIWNRVNEMKAHLEQNDNQTEKSCLILSKAPGQENK